MNPEDIHEFFSSRYIDVLPKSSWGETSYFVNPGGQLPSGSYFATIKEKDGENDKASILQRQGVFRLNFGPGKEIFYKEFGVPPKRPAKGRVIEGDWDFAALDTLMPHPIYGWMSWMCILNPSKNTFNNLTSKLDAAYEKAYSSAQKRLAGVR